MKNSIAQTSLVFSSSNLKSFALLALIVIFLLPCPGQAAKEVMVKTSSGLQYADLEVKIDNLTLRD